MTTIEVPADQLYRLASALEDLSRVAHQTGIDLSGVPAVGRDLQATVEGFLSDHRTAAQALFGELQWLGDTVGAVARSWAQLDHNLLSVERRTAAR
jgi:hypothetical protein